MDWRYRYTTTVTVSGGELFGAMAKDVDVTMTYTHFVNDKNDYNGRTNYKQTKYDKYTSTDTVNDVVFVDKWSKKKYYLCAVTITYQYQGKDIVTNLGDKLSVKVS